MNRFNNIMFINPDYRLSKFTTPVMPVGIGYLAESLKINGINYSVFDMALGYDLKDLKRHIIKSKPDLIGISMMSFMYKKHYTIAEFIKRNFPNISIIVGGPHISSCKEEVLKECESMDFAVLQEGEGPLLSLCRGKDVREIKDLIFRKNGNILYSGERESLPDLDSLPFPKYEDFELNKYGFGVSIVSSRGCPFKCIYCSAHAIRNRFRARSARNVADEMEYWYKKGYREFGFQEDNPAFDKKRLLELCDNIETRKIKDIAIMCGNGVRADKVDKEILSRMKEVGFKRLAFGVEGGNNKVLKNIKKGETIEVIKKAIKEACDLNFFVSLFFIVGSPGETPEDVDDSINIALSYPIANVSFYNLIPLPGTELYKWVQDNNYFLIKPEVYLNAGSFIQMGCRPVFETPEFPAKERVRVLRKTKKIERIVKRLEMERKLRAGILLNKLIAYIYTLSWVQKFENSLMRFFIYRKTIGILRSKVRLYFYKG